MCMHTDTYDVVRCFLNKKNTPFCNRKHPCLSWNTYIYYHNLDGKRHQEAHKIQICSPGLSSWEIIRNFNWCLCCHICVHIFVTKLHHLCMIWQVTSLPKTELNVFSASPRDDNELPIKLKCKLWPWLMAILNFWSTPKLLLGRRGRDRMVVGYITTYAISAYHH